MAMDFLKNVFDYFRGNNTRRDGDDQKISAGEDNINPNFIEVIPSDEMDIKLPEDFINRTFGGNKPNDDDMSHFQLRNNVPFFGDFSSLFQVMHLFEETINEVQRHFSDSTEFHNFPEFNFGDMRDGMLRESEKTLTGERLRNYYLNGNDPYQGEHQNAVLDNKPSDDHPANLIIDNKNRSDFSTMPYFKSQARYVTTKIGPDGVAEITTILKDESGNEERIVRKVKLF